MKGNANKITYYVMKIIRKRYYVKEEGREREREQPILVVSFLFV